MADWRNRIIRYGLTKVEEILANPYNFRIHSRMQQEALSGSLDTLGWISVVIINVTTGRLIDGHLRIILALRRGEKEVPAIYVELSEAEEAQALLSLDPIAAMAASDADKVDELLRMIQTDDERVMQHLADLAKENGLDYGQAEQEEEIYTSKIETPVYEIKGEKPAISDLSKTRQEGQRVPNRSAHYGLARSIGPALVTKDIMGTAPKWPQRFRVLQKFCGDTSPTVLNTRLSDLRMAGIIEHQDREGYTITGKGLALGRITSSSTYGQWNGPKE